MSIIAVLRTVRQALGERPRWAIIGAVARNAWAPPRATADLDLTVAADQTILAAITHALGSSGYRQVREQRAEADDPLPDILVFRTDSMQLRQVDILVAKTAFEEEVLRGAEAVALEDLQLPVARPEALVVYKLLANRPRDLDDIHAILSTQARTSRAFDWSYVERWVEFWRIRDRLDRLRGEIRGR